MRIGIIADIHEDVASLRMALCLLDHQRTDTLVVLGDIVDDLSRLEECVQVLMDAGAIGVWGNHDVALCTNPVLFVQQPPCVQAFMRSLYPTMQIEGCFFSHIAPWLDPRKSSDIWWDPYRHSMEEHLVRSFSARSERVMFYGHVHKWCVATHRGPIDGCGRRIDLRRPERYVVSVSALSNGSRPGRCMGDLALYDTETEVLNRFRV